MPESHALRRAALRTLLRAGDLDALLVVDLCNVRYLTGFTGSSGALLVHAADETGAEARTVLCTDGRYLTQSEQQVPDLERVIERFSGAPDVTLAAKAAQSAARYRRTGYESQHVTVAALDELTTAAQGVELVRAPGLVERLRIVKDADEVATLRMACAIADRALVGLLEQGGLRPGRTEREVARELDSRMLDHGAAGSSFDTIVATGAHSAIPHHRPTDAKLRVGDFVTLDFGALFEGYHSDTTRTVVVGSVADWQREIYELVAAAQAAGRQELVAGQDYAGIDAVSRGVIERAGHGEQFVHGLGHGVGLEIHEAPLLSRKANGKLSTGMAVTVEPGVYLAGRGGVRIEDVLVVHDGAPELLTLTTKDLLVV